MSGSVVLLHLAGAVALMLFATRMVKTGVERAYGDVLRHRLRATMRNPIMAVLGAEIGSALVVKLLTFDLTLLVPICLVAGTVMFMATERRDWRQSGRILAGVRPFP